MKSLKYTPLLFSLFVIFVNANAQNAVEQNCNGAISVCQPVYSQSNSYVGTGSLDELNGANEGCLASGENNTAWYILNVTSSGTLVFDITPNDPTDDYDFAVWDATGLGCATVASNPPVRCNYAANFSSSPGGLTGLSTSATAPSYGAGGPSYSSAINAVVGETYILVVDNFSSSQFGYTLDFSASTSSIFDTIRPKFTTAGSHCGFISDQLEVTMSEGVQCSSLSANGSDFYITPAVPGTSIISATSTECQGGAQFSSSIHIQFSGVLPPGTYWLHAQDGSDANTLLDNCGNYQSLYDSISFTMTPGNPPQVIKLDTPACLHARLIMDRKIVCGTVAPNGSDFTVTGPGNVLVTSALPVSCDVNGMTDTIDISFDRSIITPGTYTLHVVPGSDGNSLMDTCGLSTDNTISWTVSDQGLTATNSSPLICDPGYVQLTASTTLAPSPTGYNLSWMPGDLTTDSTAAVTQAYITHDIIYQATILDEDFCYRRDTTGIVLSVRNPGLDPMPDTSMCIGKQVLLQASGGLNYAWYPSDSLTCDDCPDPIASPDNTTTYSVIISDKYNCADTLSTNVTVFPLPIAYAGNDTTIFYGNTVQLFPGGGTGRYYMWSPIAGLDDPNIQNPFATPEATTIYTVTVIDNNQCRNTDSVQITVRTDVPVFIPSAFTPNGDGRNDRFKIGHVTFHKLQEFRIFNRWGQEVFSTTDPKDGWDGTFKGIPQEAGVYNYLIRVSYPDGRVEMFKGDVTLVR